MYRRTRSMGDRNCANEQSGQLKVIKIPLLILHAKTKLKLMCLE